MIGPEELGTKLVVPLDIDQSQWSVKKPNPDPLSHLELHIVVVSVIRWLVVTLGLFKPILDLLEKLVAVTQLLINHWQPCFSWCVCLYRRWIATKTTLNGDERSEAW
jgi:hypothetical protein